MQYPNSEVKIKSNFKKNLIWVIIFLCTVLTVLLYNSVLKGNLKDLQLINYLKHQDKTPSQVLGANEVSVISNLLKKYMPFYKEDSSDIQTDKSNLVSKIGDEAKFDNDQAEKELEETEEPVEILTENKDVIKDSFIDKENIFIDSYKLSLYRHFLSDTQAMIINFSQDKQYQDFLERVKFYVENFPELQEIMPTINMLEKYNKQYLVENPEYKESVIPEYTVVKKFIKIEKNSNAFIEKEDLKSEIYKNLDNLRNIIYSNKTQQLFFNSNL